MTRSVRCGRCGGKYLPGTYREHTRELGHRRAIATDAKIRRHKAAQAAAWTPPEDPR